MKHPTTIGANNPFNALSLYDNSALRNVPTPTIYDVITDRKKNVSTNRPSTNANAIFMELPVIIVAKKLYFFINSKSAQPVMNAIRIAVRFLYVNIRSSETVALLLNDNDVILLLT